MLRYWSDWLRLPSWHLPKGSRPHIHVSVLVPARNEADNIEKCLQSILQQDYPGRLCEIIVIDDHSDDGTTTLVKALDEERIKLLQLSDHSTADRLLAGKKAALKVGISVAKGELIITTDADCWMEPEWLSLLVSYYEGRQAKMIAAPVVMANENTLLERCQSLDFCGMMGITGAGISKGYLLMANGANLAYEKAAFEAVGGFDGIDHLASGDDMLLMQKMAATYPGQISFLKNPKATVHTHAQPSWHSFLQQRIRWASKSGHYPQWRTTMQLAVVYLFCWAILLNLLLIPFWAGAGWLLLLQLGAKTVVDYALLRSTTRYFGRGDLMWVFVSAQLWHVVYIVVVGTVGNLVKSYWWRGRRVR